MEVHGLLLSLITLRFSLVIFRARASALLAPLVIDIIRQSGTITNHSTFKHQLNMQQRQISGLILDYSSTHFRQHHVPKLPELVVHHQVRTFAEVVPKISHPCRYFAPQLKTKRFLYSTVKHSRIQNCRSLQLDID